MSLLAHEIGGGAHVHHQQVLTRVQPSLELLHREPGALAQLTDQARQKGRDALEPVPAPELLDRARDGLVTVIDVRPPEEYVQGHIAGALNIPLDTLETRLRELPRDREIVAYCRGPWCVLSFEAVARLRDAGIEARRLEDGLPEWRRAGLPIESD